MTKKMRTRIADEYFTLLSVLKERKLVMFVLDTIYGLKPRSIERYVKEERGVSI